ncbi:hypothetical protein BGX34_003182 [Mortierella sp. NVP85]|nr:hypothetical protein BGX34_003182 [Mortierella sp. NVP85]
MLESVRRKSSLLKSALRRSTTLGSPASSSLAKSFPPEAAELISEYLLPEDLAPCLSVSRHWRDMFLPLCFRNVVYRYSHYEQPEWRQTLRRYSHHIQFLDIVYSEFSDPVDFGSGCRHLKGIRARAIAVGGWAPHLMALVDENPNLCTLHLTVDNLDYLISDQKILRRLPALKSLGVSNGVITKPSTLDEILACGPRLEWLEYAASDLCSPTGDQEPRTPWNLSTLLLWAGRPFGEELLRHCPHLTQFSGNDQGFNARYVQQLVNHIRPSQPSRLQSLAISGWDEYMPYSTLEYLLKAGTAFSGLRSIKLRLIRISDGIIRGLMAIPEQPLKVSIRACQWSLYAAGVHQLLSQCVGLRHLEVGDHPVYMEDLVQQPWVCKNLEVLMLHIIRKQERGGGNIPPAGTTQPNSFSSMVPHSAFTPPPLPQTSGVPAPQYLSSFSPPPPAGTTQPYPLPSMAPHATFTPSWAGMDMGGDYIPPLPQTSGVPAPQYLPSSRPLPPSSHSFGSDETSVSEAATSDRILETDSNIAGLERRMWNQIGEMTNLRKLHVRNKPQSGFYHVNADNNTIALTIQNGGLEALCRLSRLNEVKLGVHHGAVGRSKAMSLRLRRPFLSVEEFN